MDLHSGQPDSPLWEPVADVVLSPQKTHFFDVNIFTFVPLKLTPQWIWIGLGVPNKMVNSKKSDENNCKNHHHFFGILQLV